MKTKKQIFSVEEGVSFLEAIRQRQPVIFNDQFSGLAKNRYPEGHVGIVCHMNVPVYDGQKIVALVGVANKRTDYTDFDAKQLKVLFEEMWKVILRKEVEDALKVFSEDFEKANNDLKSVNSIRREFIHSKEDLPTLICEGSFIEKETLRSLNRQQKKAVETAIRSSEKLKSIVDSLLYIDMEEFEKKNYNPSEVNVRSIIEHVTLNVILSTDEKGITLTKEIPDEITTIIVDKDKITEVLSRIIETLIRFIPENGNIDFGVSEEDNIINFELKDNGLGIPEPLATNLFVRFYRFQDEDSSVLSKDYEELKSTFFLCKNIIDTHGGDIRVKSKENGGTTVIISLPKNKAI